MRFRVFGQTGPVPPPPGAASWEKLMEIALHEARIAGESGEIPVGAAVIDPYGKVLAKAHNLVEGNKDPSSHAEILAIREACARAQNSRLPDCVLLATLEPCLMCAGAIIQAKLSGLVYGAFDAAAGCVSSNLDWLELPGHGAIWHMGGVRGEECAALLREFFAKRRSENPD